MADTTIPPPPPGFEIIPAPPPGFELVPSQADKSGMMKMAADVLTPSGPGPKPPLLTRAGRAVESFFGAGPVTGPQDFLPVAKGAAKALALMAPGGKIGAAKGLVGAEKALSLAKSIAPSAASGALAGFGFSDKTDPAGLLKDTGTGAVAGPVVAKTLQSVVAAPRAISDALTSGAETAAVRSTFADRHAVRRALKGSDEARHELGRFMLNEDMPLRSPQLIKESAQSIQGVAGPEIGAITKAADQSGALVDLRAAVESAKKTPDLAGLSKNTVSRNEHQKIVGMLEDQIAQHGEKVPPSIAHDIRMQLDQQAHWDQAAPRPVIDAWRAARGAVDSELGATMKASGLSDRWTEANARFSAARKLSNPWTQKGLSDIGAERRAANRFVSPYEMVAGAVGGGAAALGNPGGLALPVAAWTLNRYGMPVAARSMDAAGRGFGKLADALERVPAAPGAVTGPAGAKVVSPQLQAFMDAIRRNLGGPRLSPAYGDQETPR